MPPALRVGKVTEYSMPGRQLWAILLRVSPFPPTQKTRTMCTQSYLSWIGNGDLFGLGDLTHIMTTFILKRSHEINHSIKYTLIFAAIGQWHSHRDAGKLLPKQNMSHHRHNPHLRGVSQEVRI